MTGTFNWQGLGSTPGEGGFAESTVPAPGQYEMFDYHLGHAAGGPAGYIVASAPGPHEWTTRVP